MSPSSATIEAPAVTAQGVLPAAHRSAAILEMRQARFERLVESHSAYLYRYAWWLTRNRAQAEDLVQDSFLRAWRRLEGLRSQEAGKAWLTTILRREHARSFARKRPVADESIEPDSLPLAEPGTQVHPADRLALHQAVKALPEKYREPLLLQVLGGFSLAEIAQLLDRSTSAVTAQVFRAKARLRVVLEPGVS